MSKRGGAVLDAPVERYAPGSGRPGRPDGLDSVAAGSSTEGRGPGRTVAPDRGLRREYTNALRTEDSDSTEDAAGGRRRGRVRLSFDGGVVPRTIWGRVAAGAGLLVALVAAAAAVWYVRGFLLRDEHFTVAGSSSIQIEGNAHLTRPQLLSVFGEDVERNIFRIPLADRRADLERLPWVGHATVMRLLPNRVRVSVVERVPVAYVRQGTRIGLVDAHGVLLDVAAPEPDEAGGEEGAERAAVVHYSFPVLTGIAAEDPQSVRAARMKIYMEFVAALDAGPDRISHKLSEVDLSNPEDVKALIPDAGAEILVHFGGERFLERYRKYEAHLAEWKSQYPKLASVDMRYERQVVLEMQPGSSVPTGAPASEAVPGPAASSPKSKAAAAVDRKADPKLKKTPPEPRVGAAVLKARALAAAADGTAGATPPAPSGGMR